MKYTAFYHTSLGLIGITEKNGTIVEVFYAKEVPENIFQQETFLVKKAARQLKEYLAGTRREFDLPLSAEGTDFQKSVWKALRYIPYGETRSYKQVAEMIGQPNASRAVGRANNQNPIMILIPCHRVIAANGNLAGYAGGLEIKVKLLELEKTYVAR
jgi:methylated-DNA-[protein]-cysteine S-methyltransferase